MKILLLNLWTFNYFLDNINSGSGLGGTNYLFVRGNGTPVENATELQAAYNAAKSTSRYLGEFNTAAIYERSFEFHIGDIYRISSSGVYRKMIVNYTGILSSYVESKSVVSNQEEANALKTTIIIAPGNYTFGSTKFVVDAESINIVSLTGNPDVMLDGIDVTAYNVYLKGLNCGDNVFKIATNLDKLVCENCKSFAVETFGFNVNVSGKFINCEAGDYSFGSGGSSTVSGEFINCIGGEGSFGGYGGTATGNFINCVGGYGAFGSYASGVYINCVGGDMAFGGEGAMSSTARLYNCRLTEGTFPIPAAGGKLVLCIDGNDAVVTTA